MWKGKDTEMEPDPYLWLNGPKSGRQKKHADLDPDPQHWFPQLQSIKITGVTFLKLV